MSTRIKYKKSSLTYGWVSDLDANHSSVAVSINDQRVWQLSNSDDINLNNGLRKKKLPKMLIIT